MILLGAPTGVPTSQLGPDGAEHTALHPPDPTLQRMWVGGSIQVLKPEEPLVARTLLHVDVSITDVKERKGADGRRGWYIDTHRRLPTVEETRTHLYRHPLPSDFRAPEELSLTPPGWERSTPDFEWKFLPTPEILLRFSAVTFNTHKIHYDAEYARNVEGRPGES